ncbi:hypothetical protein G5714_000608 [Onychostoma macrolepis]|uniref:Uncharacterized protein n=1 Tax=Onychostoma macrolepis TaxID=369639 RepID=A0A7J6DH06_9TELE|nr:hypothetical protein G5714_000608 [Onychostoma macrolepis]
MFVHVEKTAKEAWEACWSPCEIEEDRKVSSHRTSCFDGGGHGREPEMFIQCACISVFGVDASVFTDGLRQLGRSSVPLQFPKYTRSTKTEDPKDASRDTSGWLVPPWYLVSFAPSVEECVAQGSDSTPT